jgi:hypothetical protein
VKLWLKLRDAVRRWLGWNDFATALNIAENRARERHEAQMGMLNRIEQRMINQHVGQPRDFAPAVLDWETVQVMALHELEKENKDAV